MGPFNRSAHPRCRDDGVGMVMVLGVTSILTVLVAVTFAVAMSSLNSSRQHVAFEQALAAAEGGVDEHLSLIQDAYANNDPPVDYVTPLPCGFNGVPAASNFASPEAESNWARSVLEVIAQEPACRQQNGEGEYVAFRPSGRQTVYAMGWAPSYAAHDGKRRFLKAEYLFGPAKPAQAVLTQGQLDFRGSVAVNTLNPSFPADIHSNGDVNVSGAGSLQVQGAVTASGTNSAEGSCPSGVADGCLSSQPFERVRLVNPRDYYDDLATTTSNWYDLCGDGSVREPSDVAPCHGTVVSDGGASYRGWAFAAGSASTVPVWTLEKPAGSSSTTYPGVYYVYGADAVVGARGNDADLWNITVLAESAKNLLTAEADLQPPATFTDYVRCDKYGGDIYWRLFTIQNRLPGTLFVAEGSLIGTANTDAFAGEMLAGDKVDLRTSSNTVTGSIMANNRCAAAGPNTVQGVTLHYDQTVESPIADLISTTLWSEYPAN